jgi:regulatory protein
MGSTPQEILQEAFAYLGPRDRTVAEVRARLTALPGANEELVDTALEKLRERGYLDDARYARCFAEDRRNLDNWGSGRICRRLVELGIPAELAHSSSQPEDREQELEMAVELLRRRIRAICAEDPRSRKRALDMLVRRGYDWELAYSALRRFEQHAA